MCDLGLKPKNFNPRILYVIKRKFNAEHKQSYHSHDYTSFIYILSGSCTYYINGEIYPVKKGDIIICHPGVSHGKKLSAGEEISEFHVGFNNFQIRNLPKGHLINENVKPVLSMVKYEQDFYNCYQEIILEQEKNEPGWKLILKSLVMKMIILLLKETYTNEKLDDNYYFQFESYDKATIVNTILTYINENYMKKISLDKISKNMYLSPVYISKIFKEETGDSPINYLIKVRLAKALDALEEGRLSVKAVAESVGYSDAYYFSKLFKKYYGYPPSQYKK